VGPLEIAIALVLVAVLVIVAPVLLRLILPPPPEDRDAINRYLAARGETLLGFSKIAFGGPFRRPGRTDEWRPDLNRSQQLTARLPPRPYRITSRGRSGHVVTREVAVIAIGRGGTPRLKEKHDGVWKDVH
jgi:hypothetical protein